MKRILYLCFIITSCHFPVDNKENKKELSYIQDQKDTSTLHNISYGSDPIQNIDIYFPSGGNKNHMTIIYIHGGAWFAGDKTEATHWATYFQNMGYTFVCINYKLTHTPENNIHPTQLENIDSAIHFVLSRSNEWQIQKDKLIIMGASAGGHLALQYAYRYNNDKAVKLAISLCGILDLTDKNLLKADLGGINGGTMVSWYIGDTITNAISQWRAASPLFNISKTSVPTFYIHGKKDEIIPYEQSLKAYNQLQQYKIASRIILLDSVTHDLLSIDLGKEFNEIDKFIKDCLVLK